MNIGVNCFGMRVPFYEDYDGALDYLKSNGVTSIEACIQFPFDEDAMPDFPTDGNFEPRKVTAAIWPNEEAVERIEYARSKGFNVISVHVMSFLNSPDGMIPFIPIMKEIATKAKIKYFVFSPMKSGEELYAYAPVLNRISEEIKDTGARLLIHNHEVECKMDGDVTSLEKMLNMCPDLGLELDVGWAKFGGCDSVALMEKLKDRLVLVHYKDIKADASPETRDTCFTAVGEGSIPLAAIVKKAIELGIGDDEMIIDQDDSETDMLSDIATGVKNINASV